MKAAIFKGPGTVEIGERPDPVIQEPTDAVVRVVLGCVCGSDLWYYRGESDHAVGSIGHEFIGIVGSTLVPVPGSNQPDAVLRSLLALSDVMSTGHHAAVSAGVKKGDTVAVVGDGAVGLCAVLASRRLGAERVIALSRHAGRQKMAREFGATDILEARGADAIQAVLDLTSGIGVDGALECVGTAQSIETAFAVARPGSTVGIIGVPHGQLPFAETFFRNTGWRGGPVPARIYIPELLGDVLDGVIDPGRVFDYETDLDHIADAYQAMDERRAIKSLVRVGRL